MRVIGGEFRSRVLKSPTGPGVRPTPDRLRETLFNILAPRIAGAVFADVYAGTGSVGIEAISRGAARAIFIEYNRAAVNVIRENLRSLKLENRTEVRQGKAISILAALRADIVFVDPPYDADSEYAGALSALGENKGNFVVVQHSTHLELLDEYGELRRSRMLKQGSNALSFYE